MARRVRQTRFALVVVVLVFAAIAGVGVALWPEQRTAGPIVVHVEPGATTLAGARDHIRSRLAHMNADAHVELGDGTYPLTEPFTLSAKDSGRNGHAVIYEAAPGAHPILSGGYTVRGWHLADAQKSIWSAPVPTWLQTRQLYVDGRRAEIAQGDLPVALIRTATGYTASAPALASWRNPQNIEFVYPSGPSNWTESRCRVASIAGATITMDQPCWDNTTKRDTPGTPLDVAGFGQTLGGLLSRTIATNAYELLTKPGQWYLDTARHELFYIPRPGQDVQKSTVVAPFLQTLVQGTGVHDVTFHGITFSYATWLHPSTTDGYSSFQTGAFLTGPNAYRARGDCATKHPQCPYFSFDTVPGNVAFTHAQRLQFDGDTFEHLGATGLVLGDGTQDATVHGNVFTDTSAGGVIVGGIDDPAAPLVSATARNFVTDNWFHGTSAEYQDTGAVFVGYAMATTVSNNQINDVPYSGIAIGWGGWLERFPNLPPLANDSQWNVVSNNLVFDHMKVIVDGGAIYTNGVQGSSMENGETIEGNVVLQQHHLSWGIYTDNGTEYVKVRGNVVYDALYVPLAPTYMPGVSPYFSFGGCGGGPIAYDGNYSLQANPAAGLLSANAACGGNPLNSVNVASNHTINALNQVPAPVLASAGIEPQERAALHPTPMPQSLPPYTQFP
jgi:hypothetical protein